MYPRTVVWRTLISRTGQQMAPHTPTLLHDLRIVGGIETKSNQWPWQVITSRHWWDYSHPKVALHFDTIFFCGGSLISEEWVLTAAHCAEAARYVNVSYVNATGRSGSSSFPLFYLASVPTLAPPAGAHNLVPDTEPHRVGTTFCKFILHPGYTGFPAYYNDIALVRLLEPVTFSRFIRPSCLPP